MRTEPRTENWSNPVSGLARLYEILANCKKFPIGIKAVGCISKMPETEICNVLQGSSHYTVREGEIYRC